MHSEIPTGLLAQVTNQTRGALCVGNLGSRGSFTSLADMRMGEERVRDARERAYQVGFLARAMEVRSFACLSTVSYRLASHAIALALTITRVKDR